MSIKLSDLVELETEPMEETSGEAGSEKIDVETNLATIHRELTENETSPRDFVEDLPQGIDKEIFQKYRDAIEKKQADKPLDPATRTKVDRIKRSMDLTKAANISLYGSGSQEKISNYSKGILEKTKSKDTGEVGSLLTDLMVTVKNTDLKPEGEKSFLEKLFGGTKNRVEALIAKQESVETQIDIISSKLMESKDLLIKDVELLDRLYEENLSYYDNIVAYIIAGKEMIDENNRTVIPNMLAEAEKIEDEAEKSKAVQRIRGYQSNLSRFEKRIHDLEISRVVSVQMMPQLKLIQNNDEMLADKIQDAVMNTIPLWRTQFVMALTLARQQNVAELSRQVSEASDALIVKNAEILHDNSISIKKESERDIVSMESLEKSQELLISTIEETLQIEEEAKKARMESEVRMQMMEQQLREAAIKAIAKKNEINKIGSTRASGSDLDIIEG